MIGVGLDRRVDRMRSRAGHGRTWTRRLVGCGEGLARRASSRDRSRAVCRCVVVVVGGGGGGFMCLCVCVCVGLELNIVPCPTPLPMQGEARHTDLQRIDGSCSPLLVLPQIRRPLPHLDPLLCRLLRLLLISTPRPSPCT